MDSININSFLSITDSNDISEQIKNILNNNKNEYLKLYDSVSILNEIIEEEKNNKKKINDELNYIKNIHSEAENLFSKIINILR
jgi:hypothetical protein